HRSPAPPAGTGPAGSRSVRWGCADLCSCVLVGGVSVLGGVSGTWGGVEPAGPIGDGEQAAQGGIVPGHSGGDAGAGESPAIALGEVGGADDGDHGVRADVRGGQAVGDLVTDQQAAEIG